MSKQSPIDRFYKHFVPPALNCRQALFETRSTFARHDLFCQDAALPSKHARRVKWRARRRAVYGGIVKLIVLAAGYATRLYPLTLNQPKPLLPVAGKPMMEHVLDNLMPIEEINEIFIVTNEKFAGHFMRWAEDYKTGSRVRPITVINDHSTDDANKLGAIGDMNLVLNEGKIDEDIVVVGGDNLFSQNLGAFTDYCRAKNAPVTGVYDVGNLEEIKKYNAIEIDEDDRITYFEEKPSRPKSTLTGIALYYYPQATLQLIRQYLTDGNNPDQPGRLVQWMYQRTPFYVWRIPGIWFDVGAKETLEEADRIFSRPDIREMRREQMNA
jgi:glucose-1-phosphate thymidylyltransferase